MSISNYNRLNNPTKLAYIYLTKVQPIQRAYQETGNSKNWSDYISDTTFQEFKTAVEKGKMVDSNHARAVDKAAKTHAKLNVNNYSHHGDFQKVNAIFEQAYALGMVDEDGKLLQGYEASV